MEDIESIFKEEVGKICRIAQVEQGEMGTLIRCGECFGKDAPNNPKFKRIKNGGICIATDIDLQRRVYYVTTHIERMYNCPYIKTEFD
jgi:hypothetical protein